MAYEISNYAVKATFVAATDLTNAQYQFVGLDEAIGGLVVANIGSIKTIGVLQNAPRLGEEAEVVLVGVTKLKTATSVVVPTGTSVAAGQSVGNTAGFAGLNMTPSTPIGIALTSASAGEIATVAISTPSVA